jgi:4-aminobutyrate aminotransferase-like enzyme
MPGWSGNVLRGNAHEKLTWPSKYRGVCQTVDELKKDALEVISSNCNGNVAGIIFEPIQGIGGINTFVDGYIPMITDTVRSFGGLIIADEVQTGFGRIGTKYWGHRLYNFKPDIVTMAKGIANGLPLGAVVTRKEIAKAMNFTFFNTTGGGNIQCRAAIEVLRAIDNEKLDENAEKVGGYLMKELQQIADRSTVIGDVRGAGLMIGIEIVNNKSSKEPSK